MVCKLIQQAFLLAFILLVLASPTDLSSCGPFFPEAVFNLAGGPDDEQAFYKGHLGILQPEYERRYLVVAYRILSGQPLNASQIHSVSDFFHYRSKDVDAALASWRNARALVRGTAQIEIQPYRESGYIFYPTCTADAFLTARGTLERLVRDFGPSDPQVRNWLDAQDRVFTNCGHGTSMPDPPTAQMSPLFRAHREYQIAAAYFYSTHYDQAATEFQKISKDSASPWHILAPYLVARAYVRARKFAEAGNQISAILADPAESSMRSAALALRDYIRGQSDPAAQMLSLSKRLMDSNSSQLGHDLSDFTFIYDHIENPSTEEPLSPDQYRTRLSLSSDTLENLARQDALIGWIHDFEDRSPEASRRVLVQWRQNKSLPSLLLALNHASGKDPSANELLAAASQIKPASPAFDTAVFESARIETEAGMPDRAAARLDAVLRSPLAPHLDASTDNAFRAERMKVARTFQEFLTYAPRTVAFQTTDEDSIASLKSPPAKSQPLTSFDSDATAVFNRSLPQSLWLRAALDPGLALPLRIELLRAGLVRSALLATDGTSFARELVQLKPAYADGLNSYLHTTNDAQEFEAVFWMLHHPELQPWIRAGAQRQTREGRIDDFRDNWWCTGKAEDRQGFQFDYFRQQPFSRLLERLYPTAQQAAVPGFLNSAERSAIESEQQKLEGAGSAPTFLSKSVVKWVTAHPANSRNAEALALAVKTSRYGCGDVHSSRFVRQAFSLLHDPYGNTRWAKQTPYWYASR
jgi:hypothetical protein